MSTRETCARVLVLLVVGLAVLDRLRADEPSSKYRELVTKAKALCADGETAKAIGQLGEAVALNPQQPAAYRARAICFVQRKQFEEAIRDQTTLLELGIDPARAHYERGLIYAVAGRNQQALLDANQSLQHDAKDARPRVLRAGILAKLGRIKESIRETHAALTIDPTNIEAKILKGEIFLQTGKSNLALVLFEDVLRVNQDPRALNKVAFIRSTSDDPKVRDLQKGLEFAEAACKATEYKEWNHLAMLATANAQIKRFREAEKWQLQAIKQAPPPLLQSLKARLQTYRDREIPYPED